MDELFYESKIEVDRWLSNIGYKQSMTDGVMINYIIREVIAYQREIWQRRNNGEELYTNSAIASYSAEVLCRFLIRRFGILNVRWFVELKEAGEFLNFYREKEELI